MTTINNNREVKIGQEPIEIDFLVIADKAGVKEELIKSDIWNMRLEAWIDKEGKKKIHSWMVEKEEFIKKNLFQNKILNSSITGEKSKMVILKVHKGNEVAKEIIRKLQAINITGALSVDKNFVKEYEGYEAWLIERNKVTSSLIEKINNLSKGQGGKFKLKAANEKDWPDDYYKVEEIKKFLFETFSPEDKEEGDEYGYNLLLQGALMLKFRESVANIWDYLCEVNLDYMEERDLDGIKRTLVMIFRLFDEKCAKERKDKKPIYYCFSHIIRDCLECLEREKSERNKPEKIDPLMDAQRLFDKKYSDKGNTTRVFLGHNKEEELAGELVIRDFPNLEKVDITNAYENFINDKKISKLKIINCPKLKELSCRFHELTELDTSEFSNLTYLDCQVNKIESLDLRKNDQLRYLGCVNNRLKSIDLSQNIQLAKLLCYGNQLTGLDLSNNKDLIWLECFLNPLKTNAIKINEKVNYFGAYPLIFLVRQGEKAFLDAKNKEWNEIVAKYEKGHYEMERINISDLDKLVEQLDLKNIENSKFLSKFIPQSLAQAIEGKTVYCLSLRIILDNLANQIKYRCLVFRNRLCEGENKEYEEQLKRWALDWQKCGFMQQKYYLSPGGIETLVDRYTYPEIEGSKELRRKVGYLPFLKTD
jgi:hypothetical protein